MQLMAMADVHFAWLLGEAPAPDDVPLLPAGGIAPSAVLSLVRGLTASVGSIVDGDAAWLMVVDGQVVGLISLTKAQNPSRPEIGYGVATDCQRRGHATAAVAALAALLCDRFQGLVAETAVDNSPSQAALARNGFTVVGERTDPEDGPVLCWSINFDR